MTEKPPKRTCVDYSHMVIWVIYLAENLFENHDILIHIF